MTNLLVALFASIAICTSCVELRCGGCEPMQRRGVGIVAADHVAIEHRDDLVERHDRMRDVIARAEQAALLRAMEDEERRALARLLHPRARDREQRDARRRVVVGAVPDGVAGHRVAHAVVILVRAEEDVLVAQLRIRAAHHADDVHRRRSRTSPSANADVDGWPSVRQSAERAPVHEQHRTGRLRRCAASAATCATAACAAGIASEARHAADDVVRPARSASSRCRRTRSRRSSPRRCTTAAAPRRVSAFAIARDRGAGVVDLVGVRRRADAARRAGATSVATAILPRTSTVVSRASPTKIVVRRDVGRGVDVRRDLRPQRERRAAELSRSSTSVEIRSRRMFHHWNQLPHVAARREADLLASRRRPTSTRASRRACRPRGRACRRRPVT